MQNLIGNVYFTLSKPNVSAHYVQKSHCKKRHKETQIYSEINYCHISVEDNGIDLRRIQRKKSFFEVFQRLHNKEQYAGTGIGLMDCKEKLWKIIMEKSQLKVKQNKIDIFLPTDYKYTENNVSTLLTDDD
jgi:light-regulated signal transduction histidine kinase (bacteriophytochrome)